MSTQSSWIETEASPRETPVLEVPATWFGRVGSALLAQARLRVEQAVQARRWTFLGVIFLTALAVRMAALLSLRHIAQLPGRQEGADGIEFEQLARALAQGLGYVRPNGVPTAFRAPGFPMFVSVIYRMTHLSLSAANLSFPVLGASVCVVTYLLAKEVVSERAARLSAALSVVYFPIVYFSTVWLSEPLFMFSFALSLLLFIIYVRTGRYAALAGCGLLFSWSVLVRPFAILMLPVLLVLDLVKSRRRVLTFALLLVCSLTPTLLWSARNYRLFHAFVLGATNGGSTFYGGNNDVVLRNPQSYGGWVSTVHLPGRTQIMATPNEYVHDQVEWSLGKQWVRTHLPAMPILIAMKLVRFALPDFESANRSYAILSIVSYVLFLPLWITGIRTCARKENRTLPWLLIHLSMASTVLTAVVFWGSSRFRDAAAPMLLIYAGCGLAKLFPAKDRSGKTSKTEVLPVPNPHSSTA